MGGVEEEIARETGGQQDSSQKKLKRGWFVIKAYLWFF